MAAKRMEADAGGTGAGWWSGCCSASIAEYMDPGGRWDDPGGRAAIGHRALGLHRRNNPALRGADGVSWWYGQPRSMSRPLPMNMGGFG